MNACTLNKTGRALLLLLFIPACLYAQPSRPSEQQDAAPEKFKPLNRATLAQFKMQEKLPFSGRLAFTARVGRFNRILELDLSTGTVRAVIDGPGNNEFPSWSPDGSKLAFVSDRDGNKEIYVADYDGESQTRITYNTFTEGNPDWHPDGEQIVYFRDRDRKVSNIFSSNITTGAEKQLTRFKGRNTTPRFSKDGTAIIYSTSRFWPGWDICRWDFLSLSEQCLLKGDESFCRPAFSTSGKEIVYSFGVQNDLNIGFVSFKDIDDPKTITTMKGREYDPIFGKDSKFIFFVSEKDRPGVFNIYVKKQGDPKMYPLLKAPFSMRYLSWNEKSLMSLEAQRYKAIEAAKQKNPQDFK